ncbi:MAG TPA: hypothetical protein VNV82_04705 [Bryobacteraceae bacterium]|jgi:hypothetical protein|nr:hypothetical protein [Bryobacteraceae bacterium]
MLEFVIYLISGIGYGFYFDLNPLETLLAVLAVVAVLRGWWPRFPMTRAWLAWTRLAHRRKTAVAAVFVFALLARAALLPLLPAPNPVVSDEFSHLLIADTLAHGRLTNPTHPMWVHFESLHIIQKPTYNSDYFPGQGAILALGRVTGHPWVASWLLCAAMCAALCWMLQAWLPPAWALFGATLAVFRFGIASYWVNGYYGGCLAALGGAIVLGSYPRLVRKPTVSISFLFGLGLAIIGYARPFEGLAVAVPGTVAIGIAMLRGKTPAWVGVPATAVVLMAVAGLLAYSKAVTGDPLKSPYSVNQATYGWPMTLPWFHPPPVQFRHEELRRYYDYEKEVHDRNATLWAELKNSTLKAQEMWRFYFGPALSIGLIALPLVWRSRRLRLLLIAAGLTVLAALVETGSSPHYAAAATGAFLAVLMECFRRLRADRRRLVFAAPIVMLLILGVRIGLGAMHLPFTQHVNFQSWCCVTPGNPNKARILAILDRTEGRHLVLVKPKIDPENLFQWIYNDADIDASKVVWARDMGLEGNRALLDYFRDRKIWLLDPNVEPATILPYSPRR